MAAPHHTAVSESGAPHRRIQPWYRSPTESVAPPRRIRNEAKDSGETEKRGGERGAATEGQIESEGCWRNRIRPEVDDGSYRRPDMYFSTATSRTTSLQATPSLQTISPGVTNSMPPKRAGNRRQHSAESSQDPTGSSQPTSSPTTSANDADAALLQITRLPRDNIERPRLLREVTSRLLANKIVFVHAMPGSGKTTFARQLASEPEKQRMDAQRSLLSGAELSAWTAHYIQWPEYKTEHGNWLSKATLADVLYSFGVPTVPQILGSCTISLLIVDDVHNSYLCQSFWMELMEYAASNIEFRNRLKIILLGSWVDPLFWGMYNLTEPDESDLTNPYSLIQASWTAQATAPAPAPASTFTVQHPLYFSSEEFKELAKIEYADENKAFSWWQTCLADDLLEEIFRYTHGHPALSTAFIAAIFNRGSQTLKRKSIGKGDGTLINMDDFRGSPNFTDGPGVSGIVESMFKLVSPDSVIHQLLPQRNVLRQHGQAVENMIRKICGIERTPRPTLSRSKQSLEKLSFAYHDGIFDIQGGFKIPTKLQAGWLVDILQNPEPNTAASSTDSQQDTGSDASSSHSSTTVASTLSNSRSPLSNSQSPTLSTGSSQPTQIQPPVVYNCFDPRLMYVPAATLYPAVSQPQYAAPQPQYPAGNSAPAMPDGNSVYGAPASSNGDNYMQHRSQTAYGNTQTPTPSQHIRRQPDAQTQPQVLQTGLHMVVPALTRQTRQQTDAQPRYNTTLVPNQQYDLYNM
ncbi:hypothetical protein BJ508DRAFT_310056 [Ascobolus immersus RN42]|uniref:Uncharacterized protein n=1 Tax=Ascobolus immersus RN42 TaxID=1160509 RepID=A0A3N4HV81_ASCIM|nr:hypothetical protein BJ508DRAFT_310056 [Ascobolus immersus RN42]